MSNERSDGWVRAEGDGGYEYQPGEIVADAWTDAEELLPIDSGVDDPLRLKLIFDRDEAEYEATMGCPSEIAAADWPPLAPEEFAAELIDSGPDAAAALLGSLEPGPDTAAMLAMLRPDVLSPASMVSVVAATEKLLSWVQARQHRWIAAFACPDVAASRSALTQYSSQPGHPLHPKVSRSSKQSSETTDAFDHEIDGLSASNVHGDPNVEAVLTEAALNVAAAEIGAALHFTPVTSKRRVCQAVDYTAGLPATLRAMEAGEIDRGRAGVIADRTQNLPAELRRRVELSVLPKAKARTTGQVRGIVDRVVISVDPAAAKKRHQRAIGQRNVLYRAGEDGIGVFRAELAADRALVAYSVIDQIAEQLNRAPNPDGEVDDRGIGALRADVFSDLFDQLACTGTITVDSALFRRVTARSAMSNRSPKRNGAGDEQRPAGSAVEPGGASAEGAGAGAEQCPAGSAVEPGGASAAGAAEGAAAGAEQCPAGSAVEPGGASAEGAAEGAAAGAEQCPAGSAVEPGGASAEGAAAGAEQCLAGPAVHPPSPFDEGAGECDAQPPAESAVQPHRKQRRERQASDIPDELKDSTIPAGSKHIWAGPEDAAEGGGLENGRSVAAESQRRLGTHHGRHTHLNVTISASTLAGLDDRPGELDGHGPIPADLARAIAISAETITAIAIRPGCGTGLDLGRTSYRPRLAQRDHVTTRDQTCRFPGCRRAAKRCQIDHSEEFCPGRADGGVTCPCNLCCLCAFHHGLKTGGLWDSVQHADASITWTSPTGREYTTYPRQWPTDRDDRPIAEAGLRPSGRTQQRSADNAGLDAQNCGSDEGRDDEPPF